MQASQGAYHLPSMSSPSSGSFTDTRSGCTCSFSHPGSGYSSGSGTCSNCRASCSTANHHLTPPEHIHSCPSSSSSTSTVSQVSPSFQTDFSYSSHSVFPLQSGSSSTATTIPYHLQHHLPKSVSRSSISSDGSTLLFSPLLECQQLPNYSPLTPPLSLPLEATKGAALSPQTVKQAYCTAPPARNHQANQASKLPFLPAMEAKADPSNASTAPNAPLVITPACISQLATYLAEMMVYLWFSPPQKRLPTFPKPTSAFARFCNDILTTSKSTCCYASALRQYDFIDIVSVTAQVSQSVVVLALYFVSKLQTKHSIEPRTGSEYKLTIVSLPPDLYLWKSHNSSTELSYLTGLVDAGKQNTR